MARSSYHLGTNLVKEELELLSISKKSFSCIHSKELKKQHLLYKFLQKEFSILNSSENKSISAKDERCLNEIEKAYKAILRSSLIQNHQDFYSPHSIGLTELDTRSIYDDRNQVLLLNISSSINEVGKSIVPISHKKSGVEPGFEGLQLEDILTTIYKNYPSKDARREFIKKNNADLDKICDLLKITKHLIKNTYNDTNNDVLKPEAEDVARTNTVKKITAKNRVIGKFVIKAYRHIKKCTITEKNCEAVAEVIANDIARLFFKEVQHQTLYVRRHKSGRIQFLLKGKWIDGASTLGPLAGSGKNEKVRVNEVLHKQNGVKYISNSDIPNLAEHLPFLTIQGDRDGIGSQGQNKLVLQNKLGEGNILVGIDFGHAYQNFPKVLHNFEIDNAKFSNYSILYDAPRSEIVRGLIKLAIVRGVFVDATIISSYGPDFVAEVSKLTPGADEQIFDDYIKKFVEIESKFEEDFSTIRASLEKTREQVRNTSKEYLERFKHYLTIPKEAVDLLKNFEAVFAGSKGTTLRSPDGEVLLNHLRNLNAPVQWDVKNSPNGYQLTAKIEGDTKGAFEALQKFTPENLPLKFSINGDQITISILNKNLPAVAKYFHEDNIKKSFHSKDFALYKQYTAEQNLMKKIKAFNKDQKLISLSINQDKYQMEFNNLSFLTTTTHKNLFFNLFPLSNNKLIFNSEKLEKITENLVYYQNLEVQISKFYDTNRQEQSKISSNLDIGLTLDIDNNHIRLSFSHHNFDAFFLKCLKNEFNKFDKQEETDCTRVIASAGDMEDLNQNLIALYNDYAQTMQEVKAKEAAEKARLEQEVKVNEAAEKSRLEQAKHSFSLTEQTVESKTPVSLQSTHLSLIFEEYGGSTSLENNPAKEDNLTTLLDKLTKLSAILQPKSQSLMSQTYSTVSSLFHRPRQTDQTYKVITEFIRNPRNEKKYLDALLSSLEALPSNFKETNLVAEAIACCNVCAKQLPKMPSLS